MKELNEKDVIIQFLIKSGFKEKGTNQYYNEKLGYIFLRTFYIQDVFMQIMELGKKHHANELRNLLKISDQVECYIFNPIV